MRNDIIPYNPKLKELARKLRKESTLGEVLLWKVIKGKSFGVEFHRQVPILNFIVDFYCHELKLAIEVDGSSHDSEQALINDKVREEKLKKYGVNFLRIPDYMVKKEMINVIRMIEKKLEDLRDEHPPTPPSKGEFEKIANLQFITQPVEGKTTVELVREVCEAGCTWIQLRLKNADEFVWEQEAIEVWEVCQDFGATFIINDNVEVAQRVMADGVHLGKEDMCPMEARKKLGDKAIIGGTANTMNDVRKLIEKGVDYIGLGPFKHTSTKKNLSPILGGQGYAEIIEQMREEGIDIPVVAVGGIQLTDVRSLPSFGVHGIAISGALSNAENKKELVEAFNAALN